MSFSYSAGTATNLNRVRLKIQDTDSSNAFFADEEINDILAMVENDLNEAVAQCFLIIAGNRAKLAKYKSAGRYSEDLRSLAKDLREQAKLVREMGILPTSEVAEQTFDTRTEDEFIDKENLRGEI
jgi:hypothetical protein